MDLIITIDDAETAAGNDHMFRSSKQECNGLHGADVHVSRSCENVCMEFGPFRPGRRERNAPLVGRKRRAACNQKAVEETLYSTV